MPDDDLPPEEIARRMERAAPLEDARLMVARERLQNCQSVIGLVLASQHGAAASYDGPEVSGSMKSKRRRAR